MGGAAPTSSGSGTELSVWFQKLDFPSLQGQPKGVEIVMETDGVNMNKVNEAQEGLVFFFGKIYILFISSYKEIL